MIFQELIYVRKLSRCAKPDVCRIQIMRIFKKLLKRLSKFVRNPLRFLLAKNEKFNIKFVFSILFFYFSQECFTRKKAIILKNQFIFHIMVILKFYGKVSSHCEPS